MSIQIDVSDTYVKDKLATLPEKMMEYAFEVLMQQAELMKGLAQIYVPVDTGSLRDSIRIERGGEGLHWRRVSVRAGGYVTNPRTGKLVDYAVHVERRQPFMQPAFDEIKSTLGDMLKASIIQRLGAET